MFRGIQKSKMQHDQFGVGSIFEAGRNERFLVVFQHSAIKVLSLQTFELSANSVQVEDVNFLTQEETRQIVNLTGLNYTFSDFDFKSAGLKPK